MKDLMFEIINHGFYLSFRKEKYADFHIMDINDGYAGEQCHIEPDMPEDQLVKLMRYQFEKLKARAAK